MHGDADDSDAETTPAAADDAGAGDVNDAGADDVNDAGAAAADEAEDTGAEAGDAEDTGAEAGDAEATASGGTSGVDTEHVMNLTFVLTLLFGVPTVVVLSLVVPLDGWGEIISFVVRVGAAIWFLTAVTLYVRERVQE